MKKKNIKNIGTILVFIVLFVMSMLVITNIGFRVLIKLKNLVINFFDRDSIVEEADINWKERYPIEGEYQEQKSKVEILKDKLYNIKKEIEDETSQNMIMYEKFVEWSYLYDKIIGYTLVSNNNNNLRIKIGDYWCKLEVTPDSSVDIEEKIKNIREFNGYLKDKGIDYIYIQGPHKIEKNSKNISPIYYDKANVYADQLLNGIKDEVDYMDFREIIKETGEDYLKLFFKTDHHWKPETGFWATGKIIDKLNNDYNYKIDKDTICNIGNYNIKVYEDECLGSDGRYVTLANCDMEDISIITPKFDTDLIVEIPEIKFNKRGNFEETLIDDRWLDISTNQYNRNLYSAYCHGNRSIINIYNKNVNNGIKLLIIKDSFANVVSPYLALGVQECSIIDLRYFDGSIKSYIDEYKPDMVINLYYPGVLGKNEMWTYK